MANIYVEGMKDIGENLKKLPALVRDKIARGAIFAEANYVKEASIRAAPIGDPTTDPHSGLLRKSIRVARRKESNPDLITYVGYVKGGAKPKTGSRVRGRSKAQKLASISLPYYWYFVEFGTSKMSKISFIRAPFDANAVHALNVGRDYAKARFDKIIAREFRNWKRSGMPGLSGSIYGDMPGW